MKIYYAHCISIFNTPQEHRDIKLLEDLGFEVHNPNNQDDADGYKNHGMDYCKNLVRRFSALAFRSLPNGSIPAGIYKEIIWARQAGILIIELPSSLLRREMSVDETREYLTEIGHR